MRWTEQLCLNSSLCKTQKDRVVQAFSCRVIFRPIIINSAS
jgi:hypothetical protein